MGAYHTIELELNRKFTLAKKSWDSILLDRIGKQLLLFVFAQDFSEFYLVTTTTEYQHLVFASFKHTLLTYMPATRSDSTGYGSVAALAAEQILFCPSLMCTLPLAADMLCHCSGIQNKIPELLFMPEHGT